MNDRSDYHGNESWPGAAWVALVRDDRGYKIESMEYHGDDYEAVAREAYREMKRKLGPDSPEQFAWAKTRREGTRVELVRVHHGNNEIVESWDKPGRERT